MHAAVAMASLFLCNDRDVVCTNQLEKIERKKCRKRNGYLVPISSNALASLSMRHASIEFVGRASLGVGQTWSWNSSSVSSGTVDAYYSFACSLLIAKWKE